ncbi:MAG: metallophosphoesterase [Clostridia bacterium]|nr:metallophosphoesterase [Clostridia bacterium]
MRNKNEQKIKKRKTARRVLAVIFAVIVLFIGITTVITVIGLNANIKKANSFPEAGSRDITVENTSDGVWNIYSDTGLKVLQLTDTHFGGGWMSIKKDSMALNAVAAMISAEKPDFVIVTGDVAYPVPFQSGTFNNKSGAKLFAELMETLGVYWTVSYGNHDTEAYSFFEREEITEFYEAYPHCLMRKGAENVDGWGNQVFNIVNSSGMITRSLFTVDSHSYVDNDYFGIMWKYDNIHENQIEWYKNTVESNRNHNMMKLYSSSIATPLGDKLVTLNPRSSVFLHVPLSEYKDAWNEYVENGYSDTENVKHNYGVAGESGKVVYPGIYEDNFFETMQELHSTDTVFCGHDHLNNFSVNYKGIDLTYSYSVDYLAYVGIYKLGSQRGCTLINIDENGEIEYSAENYYQDKYTSHYSKEEVTMQELGK